MSLAKPADEDALWRATYKRPSTMSRNPRSWRRPQRLPRRNSGILGLCFEIALAHLHLDGAHQPGDPERHPLVTERDIHRSRRRQCCCVLHQKHDKIPTPLRLQINCLAQRSPS